MDVARFDDLLRSLTTSPSRRGLNRLLAGLALAGPCGVLLAQADVEARKKGKKKKKPRNLQLRVLHLCAGNHDLWGTLLR
jgi:hypothetical protein